MVRSEEPVRIWWEGELVRWDQGWMGGRGEKYVLAGSCAVGHAVDGSSFLVLWLVSMGQVDLFESGGRAGMSGQLREFLLWKDHGIVEFRG